MCSALYRKLGDVFILRSSENENRNLRRRLKKPIERLYPVAVRQEQVDQHRQYVIGTLLFLLLFIG